MASKYLKEFEELNTTTESIYDLGDYEVLIILKDGTNLTSWSGVNKQDIIYVSEDLSKKLFLDNYYKDLTSLKAIIATGVTKNVYSVKSMFENCSSLVEIQGFETWDTSNIGFMWFMFEGCSSLENISCLSDWKTAPILEAMFENCSSLADLSPLANWNTSNVTDMSFMFDGCNSLTDVSPLFDWETDHFKCGCMFDNCPNIIEFPDWYLESHTQDEFFSMRENPQKKKVFSIFRENEALSPSEIAKKEDIHPNTVRTNLNKFLECNMVYITNPESKRNRTYKLTDNGKKVMKLLYSDYDG